MRSLTNKRLVNRKVEYRLYPTARQAQALHTHLRLHQRLYNAAVEQRRLNYELIGRTVRFADQCRSLTRLRATRPDYAALNAQSCQVTLKRVELAFQGFFRRCKTGDGKPGYPRFKALDRYHGWGYKTLGDGWRLLTNDAMRHGRLRLSNIGVVKLRGGARTPGLPKTCEIVHKAGRWYASITIRCTPRRTGGTTAAAFDLGTETFLTLADSTGTIRTIENPRILRRSLPTLRRAQRVVSRRQPGSLNRRKAGQRVARLHQHLANQRREFLHQTSQQLVNDYGLLATETLSVKNLTAAGGGHRKRGLNRELLSASFSQFLTILACKAEETGGWYLALSPRTIKPTQTCAVCGRQEKKLLSQRQHVCPCGSVCGRDENAARVLLQWALHGKAPGSERARCGEPSAGLDPPIETQLRSVKQESLSTAA